MTFDSNQRISPAQRRHSGQKSDSATGRPPRVTPGVLSCVRGYFERYGWPKRGAAILVALSGGPDSVCLLHVLKELAKGRNWRIVVGHVNYRLRGEDSDQDEAFCRALCREMGIRCFCSRPSPARCGAGHNLQAWAREARYRFLERIADRESFDWIAVGHNLGDRAETVAAAVLDAAGTFALSGIPPIRGRVIRPLFDCSRDSIREYLESSKLSFRTDQSNETMSYQRNRIRHETIPAWTVGNPSIETGLARLGEQLWRQQNLLQGQAERWLQRAVIAEGAQRITLDATRLSRADQALDPFILRDLARRLGISIVPTPATVERFSRLRQTSRSDRVEQGSLLIVRSKGQIAVSVAKRPGAQRKGKELVESTWKLETKVVKRASPEQFDDRRLVYLDLDCVRPPVRLRTVVAGDRYRPLGLGGSKKLSDLLADHQVPVFDRRSVAVLIDAEGILWPVGQPIADRAKITQRTRRILQVAVKGL